MRFTLAVSLLLLTAVPAHAQIYAAVLPSSRAVQVGSAATAFATIINAGSTTATGCRIAPARAIPATFSYQTTDPATNEVTGTANTPVNIPVGGSQSFVFGVTPTSPFDEDLQLSFACENQPAAPVVPGVNTLKLLACTGVPSDVISVVATPTHDGTVVVPRNGQAAFSVAAVNIGTNASAPACGGLLQLGSVSFEVRYSVIVEIRAPVSVTVCQTDSSGTCQSAGLPILTPAGTPATFSVFVTANESIPFDPANTRIRIGFIEHQTAIRLGLPSESKTVGERGSTSVAVRTQP